jgi:hypothetical protein
MESRYNVKLRTKNMNYGKNLKFAKAPRVNAMYYDKIVAAMNPNMTPYIEERQLNISQLDVFLD